MKETHINEDATATKIHNKLADQTEYFIKIVGFNWSDDAEVMRLLHARKEHMANYMCICCPRGIEKAI